MQQIVVLLVLALVWAAVLVPQHVRNRAEGRPSDSIGAFQKQLSVLERTSPGARPVRAFAALPSGSHVTTARAARVRQVPAPGRATARKRRKDVLGGLLAAMAGSLVLGFLPGLSALLGLHLALDVLFVAYVAMLVRLRDAAEDREATVRYLPSPFPTAASRAPEPALLLRRSGS